MGPEFVQAGKELGYPHCDLNAPFNEGFDLIKYPIKHGIRQGSYKAFIEPIRRTRRKNLVIRKFAHVNRIIIRDKVACGVEYDRQGATRQAFASKEVIVTAGTVNTPKLLMLSGIGPKAHLEELNIPCIQDLPVGLNLRDHVAAYVGPFFIDKPKSLVVERDLTPSAFVQWFLGGRGVLSTTGLHATGIVSSSLAKARGEGDWPDIQFFLFGFSVFKTFADAFAHGFGLTLDEQHKFWDHGIDKEAFLVAVSGARPYSRGYIKLGGRSPYDAPIIDPRYFTDPGDQDLLSIVEGVKILLLLSENTTALGHDLGTRYTNQPLPGCEHLEFRSDAYWECHVRRYTVTLHHPVGTASLGSVVDTQLRVFGIQNLRVMDASVEPVLVTTNTQASTFMIAEKGSDLVLKYWKEKEEQEKLKQSQYGPPKQEYGGYGYGPTFTTGAVESPPPPQPTMQYGPPSPPSSSYSVQYGPPTPPQNTVETSPSPPPQPTMQYGPPSPPSSSYSVQYGPPTPPQSTVEYGTPSTPPPASSSSAQYGPPTPPSLEQSPPVPSIYESPPKELTYEATSWYQQKRSSGDSGKLGNDKGGSNATNYAVYNEVSS